jgi:RP/EB family microtubule-associated protein
MSEAIGMMEGAFFVSRGDILQWINTTYDLNLTKIEQLGSGSVYCQIFDSIHPGKINMSKVNWKAHLEWEYIQNLKLLQQAFLKCKLSKYIEVERLAKAKYQDNLEMAQWMKRYYDLNGGANKDYDAVARRGGYTETGAGGETGGVRKNVHNEEKVKAPLNYGARKKEIMRSGSPHRRVQVGRARGDFSNENKHTENEAKTLFQNLMAMKKIVKENNPNSEEKLGRIYELLTLSLKNSMFEGERRKIKEKENIQAIEKIVEDDKDDKEVSVL